MKGILIFLSGAATGAAVTYLIGKRIFDKKYEEECLDLWEEVDVEEFKRAKEEKKDKEEIKKMPTNEEIDIADRHNEAVLKHVEQHREPEITVKEPVLVDKQEWDDCRYTHSCYQYFAIDNLLIDDQLHVVNSDICGTDYIDVCERDGVAYVRNDEEEEIFEIEYYDYRTYEEVKNDFLSDEEIDDDIDMYGNIYKEDSSYEGEDDED